MYRWPLGIGTIFAVCLFATGLASADDRRECARIIGDNSIAACTRAIESGKFRGGDLVGILGDRGFAYYMNNDYDRAIADFNEALRLDPGYARAFLSRGEAYSAKGDRDHAIADLTEAIRLDPSDMAFLGRGHAYRLQGDHDRAIVDLTEAIRLDPKRALARVDRARAYIAKGELDRAIADSSEAIRLDPKSALGLHSRGLAHEAKGDHDRAIADFTEAIRLDHDYASALTNRGLAYEAKGDRDRAEVDFTAALAVLPFGNNWVSEDAKPASDVARERLAAPAAARNAAASGYAHYTKGEHDRAIADYREAIRLDPRQPGAFIALGYLYRAKVDFGRAIASFNEAIRLDPKDAGAFFNRGLTYQFNGERNRAIADFTDAIRLDPGYTAAYASRGVDYEAAGEFERAKADFNGALAIPQKYDNGKWAHEKARERLAAIAARVAAPPAPPPVAPTAVVTVPARPIAERRVALVIGNSAYTAVAALPNPQRDAAAIAAALRAIGFQKVTLEINTTRDRLVAALRAFEDEAEKADWAVIYYAGHGIEMSGVNYLVPVDAKLKADRDVQDEAVPLDRALSAIEGAKKLRLVVLDACRDNPFVQQMRRTVASRSIGRGLARIEPDGGTLVAYAAKHGQTALDGDGSNSPFATALLLRLAQPNVEINKLFRLVRDDVLDATGRRQEPYVYGSLPGQDFYFVQK